MKINWDKIDNKNIIKTMVEKGSKLVEIDNINFPYSEISNDNELKFLGTFKVENFTDNLNNLFLSLDISFLFGKFSINKPDNSFLDFERLISIEGIKNDYNLFIDRIHNPVKNKLVFVNELEFVKRKYTKDLNVFSSSALTYEFTNEHHSTFIIDPSKVTFYLKIETVNNGLIAYFNYLTEV